jgi:hypothetical protein
MKHWLDDDDIGYEEEQDETLLLIGWGQFGTYKQFWGRDGCVFILKEVIDNNTVILYDNFKHVTSNPVKDNYTILSDKELKNHIYNNETPIGISYEYPKFDWYLWKDLPKEIREAL